MSMLTAHLKGSFLSFNRPGMTRVNFPYFMNQDTVDYIIKAVTMVAKQGWKLLSQVSLSRAGTILECYQPNIIDKEEKKRQKTCP